VVEAIPAEDCTLLAGGHAKPVARAAGETG